MAARALMDTSAGPRSCAPAGDVITRAERRAMIEKAMSTLLTPARDSVVLHGVSWETYQQLLTLHEDNPGKRFFYDEGELEVMVVSARHERPNRWLALLVDLMAAELGIELDTIGSMTCQREDLQKGFEPDSGFYVGRGAEMETREIDLEVDPP